jgi:Mce-associated membrane protein
MINYRQSWRIVSRPPPWWPSRFRNTAEGIGDEVRHPSANTAADADESKQDATLADASPEPRAEADVTDEVERDAVSDQEEDPRDAIADRPQERPKIGRIKAVRWAAAGVLAATLVGAGSEGWLLFQHHQTDVAAAQALDAAKKYVLTLTSVDTNAIDKNFAEVLDGSTGEFKDMYTKSTAQLRQTLIDNKAAAHGSIIEAAVRSATNDRVEVVLFVDQSVSNAAAPAPQLDRSRVKMTMEKVDGRWLASKVELP